MAQLRGTHFAFQVLLELLAQHVAHTPQPDRVRAVFQMLGHHHATVDGTCALGDADQRVALLLLALLADADDLVQVIGLLGNQDDVCTTGQAAFQRDPARIAAHRLQHHHPAMAAGRGFQPCQRLGHDGHRTVEAEGALGVHQVVVDGLGHAHHRQTQRRETVGDAHRAVATDGHQRVQPQLTDIFHHLVRDIHTVTGERIGEVVGAQNGAALVQDAGHRLAVERTRTTLDHAHEAPFDAGDTGADGLDERIGHPTDHRIQTRAVAAAGQDTDMKRRTGH